MVNIFFYLFKLGAHLGSSTSEYNYSSSLNQYLLGSMYNYYIIDLRRSLYLLKRALYFLIQLGISNAHLLFFYFLPNIFKIYFFFLIKKKNKHSFVNDKWIGGSITNYKFCFYKILNTFISSNIFKKLRKKNFFFKSISIISSRYNFFFFKFLFLKILLLNLVKSRSNYFLFLKQNKKYWNFFFFLRSFSYILKKIDCFIFFNDRNNLVPVYEFSKRKIPVIGLVDTNTPYYLNISYPIISNDDSILLSFFYINVFLNAFNIGNYSLYKQSFSADIFELMKQVDFKLIRQFKSFKVKSELSKFKKIKDFKKINYLNYLSHKNLLYKLNKFKN